MSVPSGFAQADVAPCGYVDGFEFPVPDIDVEHTDFALYRARFGGLHVGIDVAFEQLGDPVRAAARGRVTYSDTAGWDTEKGVVVIQHTFPDGTLVNTLYGHMEELNGHMFPAMNQCVEQGTIIGAVGFPSLGRPHLHYEVRTRYRHEGGPGYTDTNPLTLGWFHPVDFTYLARAWVHPAYRDHVSLIDHMTLPPLLMPDGGYVTSHSTTIKRVDADGQVLWQFDTLGSVMGLVLLPDGRILVNTSADQILVLDNGSYSALWPVTSKPITPPLLLGEAVVFITEAQTVIGYTFDGAVLWETQALPGQAARWVVSGERLAVGTTEGSVWVVDSGGNRVYQGDYPDVPIPFAGNAGEFYVVAGSAVWQLNGDFDEIPLFDTERTLTPDAELLPGPSGEFYLYSGEGRSLYAYDADGALLWIAYMPGSHLRAPYLRLESGRLVYALTTDGQLLAYDTADGRLVTQIALYDGGVEGVPSARWLDVSPEELIHFSSGYLTIITLDGHMITTEQ
ncbi:MAG: PQQ-binding-like beta-propeller repeat protein [Anaerolineae bacterium]|nr:PQQ-binding-like beta-propeller repeat protein [Anaerolineae bacterium]